MTTSFDRLRVRTPHADPPSAAAHDTEGKRALFSAAGPEPDRPSLGAVTIDCPRCQERTVLTPAAAVRAAVPSLVLSVGIGRGEQESTVGLLPRRDGAYLRCPACRHRGWVRLTIRL